MRACDLIADFLYEKGITDVFMVAGGGSMFLTDGLASHNQMNVVPCHHEQAAAMAAVAYAKYKGMGGAFFTTGCGGTNAITGVLHAYQDHARCIFVSGQCRQNETVESKDVPLRQVGLQEAPIIDIVRPITKYAVRLTNPQTVLLELEKAFYIMNDSCPGPVWLDVPIDIQKAEVEPSRLLRFEPMASSAKEKGNGVEKASIIHVAEMLRKAKRTMVLAGQGVRQAGAIDLLEKFLKKNHIPMVNSRLGLDLLPMTDSFHIGRIGYQGTRAANICVQNADVILVIGSRLSLATTGYQTEKFGKNSKIITVDIDENEHKKGGAKIEKNLQMDAREFLERMCCEEFAPEWILQNEKWCEYCNEVKRKYPIHPRQNIDAEYGIDMYDFVDALSEKLREEDVVVTDTGSIAFALCQGLSLKSRKQRFIISGAQSEMGFALPGAIGAAVARGGAYDVIAVVGDGSFQMNLQELQTIIHHGYPVKIFYWNNQSYLSIKHQQEGNFEGRLLGCDKKSGVSFPSVERIAGAYGFSFYRIDRNDNLGQGVQKVLAEDAPTICELVGNPKQRLIPQNKVEKMLPDGQTVYYPLENMDGTLSKEELQSVMLQ